MLLEVRQRLNAKTYTECGKLIFGTTGEYVVNIALGISQLSFCISFLYFIIGNSVTIFTEVFGLNISKGFVAFLWFLILCSLALIRKVEIFAATYIFADLMVAITLFVVLLYAISTSFHESKLLDVLFMNTVTYSDAFGTSIFAFEAIGLIIPI